MRHEIAAARDQAEEVLRDNLPAIIGALSVELDAEGHGSRDRELFIRHAKERMEMSNYSMHDLMREYGVLREVSTAKLGAELIRRGPGTRAATERLADQILASIARSDQMIADLLDSQRIRAGKKLSMNMSQFSMNDLVDEVVSDCRGQFGDRFVVQAECEVPGFWNWESMRRAIENLLSNAAKYSSAGSPITIRLWIGAQHTMSLSVHNQGPPLSPDEQARIFRPFERGKSAEQSGKSGWGIGLTLVQGIANSHGGKVTVSSSSDGGTTFTIVNPMDSRPYQVPGE